MKKVILIILIIVFGFNSYARKTRSDKGGHHKHSTEYYLKHSFNDSKYSSKKYSQKFSTNTSKNLESSNSNNQISANITTPKKVEEVQKFSFLKQLTIIALILLFVSYIIWYLRDELKRRKR